MKYIKYIAIMLIAAATLACEDAGTVGTTSVGFKAADFSDGFSLGTIYVPLTIEAEEGSENTADVELTVDVVSTDDCVEIEMANGELVDGDFMITSHDMVFRPGVKEVGVEIDLITPEDRSEFSFTLEIVSSNTTIDAARKQCVVTIKKDARDALAGTYRYTGIVLPDMVGTNDNSFSDNQEFQMKWNNSYGAFVMPSTFAFWSVSNAPLVFNFYSNEEAGTVSLSMPAVNMVYNATKNLDITVEDLQVEGADPNWDVVVTTRILIITDLTTGKYNTALQDVTLNVDAAKGTIAFPSDATYAIAYCVDLADSAGNVKMHVAPYSNFLYAPSWKKR